MGARVHITCGSFVVPPVATTVTPNKASYDDIGEGEVYDAIFSIEALVHSPNLLATLQGFADHMEVGSRFVVIDDFLTSARFEHGAAIDYYRNYWLGGAVQVILGRNGVTLCFLF